MKQQHRFINGIAALLATASGMTGVPDAKGADGLNYALVSPHLAVSQPRSKRRVSVREALTSTELAV